VTTGDANLTIDALHTDESGLNAQRAVLEEQEAQDQAGNQSAGSAGQRRTPDPSRTECQAVRNHRPARPWPWPSSRLHRPRPPPRQSGLRRPPAAAASPSPQPPSGGRSATSTTQPARSTPGTPAGASSGDPSLPSFLQCVLRVESGGNYNAISPGGAYMGGFQFSQPTWNEAAQLAGMPQLVNVPRTMRRRLNRTISPLRSTMPMGSSPGRLLPQWLTHRTRQATPCLNAGARAGRLD